MKKVLLTEGGAAGHMAHPFDLEYVKTGQDLLSFFTDKVPEYLETNVPVIKTDGTNVSFKLISKTDFYGEEKREFAADRGSQKALDIEGLTASNIEQRFKPNHGLIPGILDVLAILNAALDAGVIDEEIKAMGLVDNPDYFINTEHVKETEERPQVNAIKYDENFIAFHGVNEFFMTPSPKGKSMSRKSKEVASTKNSSAALQSFTNKVRRFSRDYNVYGPEDTKATKREGVSINFDSALGEKLPIFLSEGTETTDTLGGWLRNPRTINPFGATIVLADGRKMGAMSKHVYTNLAIDKVPVSDLLGGMEGDKQQMAIDAINGAIFYHATRNLGVAVLKTLDAGFGGATLDKHEGIVMRDKDVFGVTFPIKITGDFIVEGMVGAISQEMAKEDPAQVKTEIKRKIAVFPGKFKPPHRGHMDLVKGLVDKDVDQVYILISPLPVKTPAGKVIDRAVSEKIWKIYIDAMGIGNKVTIGKSEYNSPVKSSFDVLAGKVSSYVPEPGDLVIPAASDKIDERSGKPDYMRFENFHKGVEGMLEGVTPANIMDWYFKAPSEAPMSATDFREALDTGIGLEAFLPAPRVTKEKVLALLGVEMEPEVEEPEDSGTAPALYMGEDLMEMIREVLNEELGLDEISSMAGGSVEGFASGKNKKSLIREDEPEDINELEQAIGSFRGASEVPRGTTPKVLDSLAQDSYGTLVKAREDYPLTTAAGEIVAGFIPGLGQGIDAADLAAATAAGDAKAAGMSGVGLVPGFGDAAKIIKRPAVRKRVADIGSNISKLVNPKVTKGAVAGRYIPDAVGSSIQKGQKNKETVEIPATPLEDIPDGAPGSFIKAPKDVEEPIIAEVLNYLLSKMEIL